MYFLEYVQTVLNMYVRTVLPWTIVHGGLVYFPSDLHHHAILINKMLFMSSTHIYLNKTYSKEDPIYLKLSDQKSYEF